MVAYLRDNGGQPVSHKRVSISINEKTYEKITDDEGKILLKLNLKPGTYSANIKFDGDDNCTASHANAIVKVKRHP